jgi:hypothetical protein
MGKLTDCYVEISAHDGKLMQGLAATRGKLEGWAREAGSALKGMTDGVGGLAAAGGPIGLVAGGVAAIGAAAVAAGVATTSFLIECGNKAGDLAEAINKVEVAFGDSAGVVKDFAQEAADRFGLVKKDTLDAAGAIGLMAQGAGMGQAEAARFSTSLTMLAADMTSLYNVPLPEMLLKLQSGLAGESEPLRRFGINLLESAVEARAVELGLAKAGEAVSDYAKIVARADLIFKGAQPAHGDLENTQDSLANRKRKLAGDWENFQTDIGAALIDPMSDALQLVNELAAALSGLGDSTSGMKVLGQGVKDVVDQLRLAVDHGDLFSGLMVGFGQMVHDSFGNLFFTQEGVAKMSADRDAAIKKLDDAAKAKRKTGALKNTDWKAGEGEGDLESPAAKAKKAEAERKKAEKDAEHAQREHDRLVDHIEKEALTKQEAFNIDAQKARDLYDKGDISAMALNRYIGKRSGLDAEAERVQDEIFKLENPASRRVSGKIFNDLASAHDALQSQALESNTQKDQLEALKAQLGKLEEVKQAILARKPGAFDEAHQLILKGRDL